MFLNHLTELPKSKDDSCQEQTRDEVSVRTRQKGREKQGSALSMTDVTVRARGRGKASTSS